jgi:benzoyl-CoA reductase/2-hydroxyglutaryl-CoA dehydratase subunit BcrC/BadD/HgdB
MMEKQPKTNRLETVKIMNEIVSGHWESLRRAKEAGKPTVWSLGMMSMLTRAIGIPTHTYATYASLAARNDASDTLLEEAETDGFSPETCSYFRLHLGLLSTLSKEKPLRADMQLPMPDLVISTRCCTEQPHIVDAIHRRYGVPAASVDTPMYCGESDMMERVIRYVEEGIREQIIPSIEKLTGKPYDYDKLSEALAIVKKCAEIRDQCLELSRNIPAPWSFFDMCISSGALQNVGGTPAALRYFEQLHAELKDRVARGIGSVEPEKYRLLYDAAFMMWRWFGPFARKLVQAGACLVTSRYINFLWPYPEDIDPANPLYSFAKGFMRGMNWMTAEEGERLIAEFIPKYSIDGIFTLNARTCRAAGGFQDIVKEMDTRFGVPGVIIDADQIDPKFFSEAQLDIRLQALFETIDARRKNKAGRMP